MEFERIFYTYKSSILYIFSRFILKKNSTRAPVQNLFIEVENFFLQQCDKFTYITFVYK